MVESGEKGGVVITNADIYNEVVRLKEAVAPLVTQGPDHEIRIRRLERWKYALPVGLGTSFLSVAVILVGNHG